MRHISWVATLGAALMMTISVSSARATDILQTYDLSWSGINGSTGSASAVMTLDLTTFPATSPSADISGSITSLTLTITGASSGNGTFSLSDFTGGSFNVHVSTPGVTTLNMLEQLVGQPVTQGGACPNPGGTIGWGTSPGNTCSGDFNLFSNGDDASAPTGIAPFTLGADGGAEDRFILTSFDPVPEPMSAALLASGLICLGWLRRRRTSS